ncbi:MAG: maleylpyruvate isomerase N-terminal domain-containing protein, partial [Actinomycetota bacterium]
MTSADVPQSERFRVDLDPGEVLAAYVRQRRRFAASVASMDSAALAQPTRCHLWSVADVLRHLADV